MPDVKFKLIINGKQVDAVMDNTVDQIKHVKRQAQTVTEKFANWSMIVTGINQGMQLLRGATQWIGEAIDAYKLQEQAEKQLEVALGKRSEALLKYASAQQAVTTHGDEEIIKAQALIAAFTKEEDGIKKLTKAALNLADAKGMDLVTAADLLTKTYGSSTNALSRYGLQVEGTAKSSERLENVVNAVNDVFGGQAEALAQTDTGKMTQAYNQMGDDLERVGEIASRVFAPILQNFADSGTAIFNYLIPVETSLDRITKSAAKQKTEFNHLTFTYLNLKEKVKLTNAEKKILHETIGDLQREYPNYLGNINLEKVGYEEAKTAIEDARVELDKYLNSMIRKGALQANEEKLIELGKQANEIILQRIKAEEKLDALTDKQKNKKPSVFGGGENRIGKGFGVDNKASEGDLFQSEIDAQNKRLEELTSKEKELREETQNVMAELDKTLGLIVAPKNPSGNKGGGGKIVIPIVPIIDVAGLDVQGLDEVVKDEVEKKLATEMEFRELKIDAMEEGLEKELALNDYHRDLELLRYEDDEFAKFQIKQNYTAKKLTIEEEAQQQRIANEYAATTEILGAMSQLFEHSKGLSYVMAFISALEAGNAALAMKPWSPLNYVFAAAAVIKGIATAKKINEQKAPKAETGGWIGGNRHSAGGTNIEAERDEFIVNRNSALKNPSLLEAINSDRVGDLRRDSIQMLMNVEAPRLNVGSSNEQGIDKLFATHFEKLDKWQKEFTFKQKGEDLYAANEIQTDKKERLEF